ncbi:hypothetical protein FOZ60_001106 [Perkinsus olseni]|uniref:Uncharacterized protein n=1 Tax=Perkinsus olseni TaxID=32597 RepID=A0A7J6P110_PEROL|nr:hypothetical protein FOZ60_001106 [Perkinsus olseni]
MRFAILVFAATLVATLSIKDEAAPDTSNSKLGGCFQCLYQCYCDAHGCRCRRKRHSSQQRLSGMFRSFPIGGSGYEVKALPLLSLLDNVSGSAGLSPDAAALSASLKAAHTERPDRQSFSASVFASASESPAAATLRQPLSSPSMRFAILMVAATFMATFGLKVDALPGQSQVGRMR